MSSTNTKLRFIDKSKSEFFATVKIRVEEYFTTNKLSKNANGLMYFKTFLFLGGTIGLYCLMIFGSLSIYQLWLLSIVLGMFIAFIGFNVSHDGIHGAYSANPLINKIVGNYSFYFIGASPYVWNITHNQIHHTFTNIPEHDEDIEVAPGLIRLSPEDKLTKMEKYQHFYGFLLYGLASVNWVLKKDYLKFFQKKIGAFDNSKHTTAQYFNLFFFKAVYYVLFIVVPLMVLDITWWQFIIGFMTMHFFEGLVLGLVFQLAHVVEGTDFPPTNAEGNIEEAWAVHQMQTTANFGRKDFITSFLCGGLNQQIEHHLFPKVCHVHYPAISDIVKQTAEEFGVPYIENRTFFTALKSHYTMLKRFGYDAFIERKAKALRVA
ncbi:MAG TPA: acyl-CoA desaturase [Cytophagaceae bacterium]|jgi:linoleoyl-CoA desaturase|nr:acyl-CoA desaturase [Cytophagaceae bacterium]